MAVNSWQFGVAVGVGARSNPLVGGDTIPLVLLPDIAWYGENAYFDNGELGYQWQLSPTFSLDVLAKPNAERGYFSFWHPSNIFQLGVNADLGLSPVEEDTTDQPSEDIVEPAPSDQPSVDDISKRRWAIDAGMRLHWYFENSQWNVSVLGDGSNVHGGYSASTSYSSHHQLQEWALSWQVALTYKSADLIDYYYGIDQQDTENQSFYYQAQSVLQAKVSLQAQRKINENWRWLLKANLTSLGNGMTQSALVKNDNVLAVFVGMAYSFQ